MSDAKGRGLIDVKRKLEYRQWIWRRRKVRAKKIYVQGASV